MDLWVDVLCKLLLLCKLAFAYLKDKTVLCTSYN